MIEPRSANENVHATLARARALIERQDLDSAALLFFQVLETELPGPLRAEVQTNLAAALCTLASARPPATAAAWLDRSRDLLTSALSLRHPDAFPMEWTTTRANLALVHLARYKAGGSVDDLMLAHLALDGTEQILSRVPGTGLSDWIAAIRIEMSRLRTHQGRRRQGAYRS